LAQVLHLLSNNAMNHGLDIIPISSYRHVPPDGPRTHLAVVQERKGSGRRVALVMGWILLIVAVVAHSWVQKIRSIRALPPAERVVLYERTMSDTESACATPEAGEGALHDHCQRQAEFLVLFPECDVRCQRLAQSILPHARR
jgi:hypothetical protein